MAVRCYLDNNATTPLDTPVLEAMLPYLREQFGNPSSLHQWGLAAARAVQLARAQVAQLLGAESARCVSFNSGGSEGIATVITAAAARGPARPRFLCSTVEHPAVLKPLQRLAAQGRELVAIGVDADGRLDLDACLAAIDERCALLSLQWANNETGVLLPEDALRAIGERARACGAWLHVDAMQIAGKLPIQVGALPIDALTLSAHKFHGPKGVGALYLRPGFALEPLILGGGQEMERRAGTENVAGIAGLGAAAQRAAQWLAGGGAARLAEVRDAFESGLARACAPHCRVRVHGHASARLPNTASLLFEGLPAETLQMLLDAEGVGVSTGSACSSESRRPSHVLVAMGCSADEAASTLRFSLSRLTQPEELSWALEAAARSVASLSELSAAG